METYKVIEFSKTITEYDQRYYDAIIRLGLEAPDSDDLQQLITTKKIEQEYAKFVKYEIKLKRLLILQLMAQAYIGKNRLLTMNGMTGKNPLGHEKLKCILSYFAESLKRINDVDYMNETVSFIRTEVENYVINSDKGLCQIEITNGTIEDNAATTIVDFADEAFGVLAFDGNNVDQEEVVLLTYPESIIGRLFFTLQKPNQALLIENLIRFNDYTGYRQTFKWVQRIPQNMNQSMIALDAKRYFVPQQQFTKNGVDFDILKAVAGFVLLEGRAISTGKWGCGVYKGDPILKTLIQWLVASQANCSKIIFNGFNDPNYVQQAQLIYNQFSKYTVKELYQHIMKQIK